MWMTATRSTNQREQTRLKMPLTRRGWRGWPRSDRAPYGDCGTLGPFGCIGLSVKRLVIDYPRKFGPQTCLGEEQSGSMAPENMWIMTHLWSSTSSLLLSCSSSSTFCFKDVSACLAVLAASENATWLARIALRSKELR